MSKSHDVRLRLSPAEYAALEDQARYSVRWANHEARLVLAFGLSVWRHIREGAVVVAEYDGRRVELHPGGV